MLNLLDPLFAAFARLTVARGILFSDLTERLKPHYLEAARTMAREKVTDSRLSVLTGLQRRDIARLRDFEPTPARASHLTRLVALWQTDAEYLDHGTPRVLPRNGPAPSFEALARQVRRDVHPRTLLDTLVATDTVSLEGGETKVRLVKSSYQPLAGSEDQLNYLALNIADHLASATENVMGHRPPHFERATHYSHLSAEQVETLKAEFEAGQMQLLETLSAKAAAMKGSGPQGTHRFRAGGYFYQTEEPSE